MTVVENPRWGDAGHGCIILDIVTAGERSTFVASSADVETHGRALYADAIAGAFGPIAPAPEPPAPAVPSSVTRAQAKIALHRAGRLEAAEAAVEAAADLEVTLWWRDALSFERSNTHIAAIAAGLGWTEAELDALFTAAAAISE